ncbi:hypothetical protein BgiBS90_017136 [Biomphalaria glabrata]|nr:hypothetical protein BgiBS90_017136 [Biomphalaria glabrata]
MHSEQEKEEEQSGYYIITLSLLCGARWVVLNKERTRKLEKVRTQLLDISEHESWKKSGHSCWIYQNTKAGKSQDTVAGYIRTRKLEKVRTQLLDMSEHESWKKSGHSCWIRLNMKALKSQDTVAGYA